MQIIGYVFFAVVAIVQVAAAAAGLEAWLDVPAWVGFLGLVVSVFVLGASGVPVPLVAFAGVVLGVFGAVEGWELSWPAAVALFAGPPVVLMAIAIGFIGTETLKSDKPLSKSSVVADGTRKPRGLAREARLHYPEVYEAAERLIRQARTYDPNLEQTIPTAVASVHNVALETGFLTEYPAASSSERAPAFGSEATERLISRARRAPSLEEAVNEFLSEMVVSAG